MNCSLGHYERLGTHHFENPTLPLAWNLSGWDGGRQSFPVHIRKGDWIPLCSNGECGAPFIPQIQRARLWRLEAEQREGKGGARRGF